MKVEAQVASLRVVLFVWISLIVGVRSGNDRNELEPFACEICVKAWQELEANLTSGSSLTDLVDFAISICTNFVYSDEDSCRVQIEMHAIYEEQFPSTVLAKLNTPVPLTNGWFRSKNMRGTAHLCDVVCHLGDHEYTPTCSEVLLDDWQPTLSWVIKNTPNMDFERLCGMIFGAIGCRNDINPEGWLIELPQPPDLPSLEPSVPPDSPVIKIVHISDFHWDPEYAAGTESLCADLICCSAGDGPGLNEPAGKFGSYNDCDTPRETIGAVLQHVLETHWDSEIILFTGDIPHHDIWNRTARGNLQMMDTAMSWLKANFENSTLYPILGNSETIPFDVYSFADPGLPEELSTQYVFEDAWKNWQHWLPADQENNVLKSGQYSVSPQEGLRIIGFNSMFGYLYNWFVWMGKPDPNEHLAWLAHELHLAQQNDENVFLVGHVPPGSSELDPIWSHNFYRIINRFGRIIKGQFYGHTHKDEFSVFFDEEDRPFNVAFIGPSVTPYYEKLNPGYRVYYVDGARGRNSTWAVLDHETWIFDLQAANDAGEPLWVKSYSMKEAYDLPDLSPQSYAELSQRLKTDVEVFEYFYAQYYKQSGRRPPCDMACRERIICSLLTSDASDPSHC